MFPFFLFGYQPNLHNTTVSKLLLATSESQLTAGFSFIHHHSLGLDIQPVFYLIKSIPIQASSSMRGLWETVSNALLKFGQTTPPAFSSSAGHFVIGDQVGQTEHMTSRGLLYLTGIPIHFLSFTVA